MGTKTQSISRSLRLEHDQRHCENQDYPIENRWRLSKDNGYVVLFRREFSISAVLPAFEGNEIAFHSNQMPFFQKTNCCELGQILSFDPYNHERLYWKEFGRKELVMNPSFNYWMGTPTRIMQSYLILFVASSIARYRPILWASILSGDTNDKAAFALSYRDALLKYAQFGLNSRSFLHLFGKLLNGLMQNKFELKHLP
jgi:hypothetical protein